MRTLVVGQLVRAPKEMVNGPALLTSTTRHPSQTINPTTLAMVTFSKQWDTTTVTYRPFMHPSLSTV